MHGFSVYHKPVIAILHYPQERPLEAPGSRYICYNPKCNNGFPWYHDFIVEYNGKEWVREVPNFDHFVYVIEENTIYRYYSDHSTSASWHPFIDLEDIEFLDFFMKSIEGWESKTLDNIFKLVDRAIAAELRSDDEI